MTLTTSRRPRRQRRLRDLAIGITIGCLAFAAAVYLGMLATQSPESTSTALAKCLSTAPASKPADIKDDCHRLLRRSDVSNTDRAKALAALAKADLATGASDDAFSAFGSALTLTPADATLFDRRGQAYLAINKPAEANADFIQAISLEPKQALYRAHRAAALSMAGDDQQAITAASNALALDPTLVLAYLNRGTAEIHAGDLDQAIADFSQAIQRQPQAAAGYLLRAGAYRRQGQAVLALQDAGKAIDLAPDSAYAHHLHGAIALDLHQVDQAMTDLAKAISLTKGDSAISAAYMERAAINIEIRHDLPGALNDIEQAITHDATAIEAQTGRCFVLTRLGRASAALGNCDRAIELDGKNARLRINRGLAHLSIGNWHDALADFTQAIEIARAAGGDNKTGADNRGGADNKGGASGDAIAYFLRAYAHERQGEASAALSDYAAARAANPNIDAIAAGNLGVTAGAPEIKPAL
jgi:serine/threonine-protein kinase